jgi:hypothetical protein
MKNIKEDILTYLRNKLEAEVIEIKKSSKTHQ